MQIIILSWRVNQSIIEVSKHVKRANGVIADILRRRLALLCHKLPAGRRLACSALLSLPTCRRSNSQSTTTTWPLQLCVATRDRLPHCNRTRSTIGHGGEVVGPRRGTFLAAWRWRCGRCSRSGRTGAGQSSTTPSRACSSKRPRWGAVLLDTEHKHTPSRPLLSPLLAPSGSSRKMHPSHTSASFGG